MIFYLNNNYNIWNWPYSFNYIQYSDCLHLLHFVSSISEYKISVQDEPFLII